MNLLRLTKSTQPFNWCSELWEDNSARQSWKENQHGTHVGKGPQHPLSRPQRLSLELKVREQVGVNLNTL